MLQFSLFLEHVTRDFSISSLPSPIGAAKLIMLGIKTGIRLSSFTRNICRFHRSFHTRQNRTQIELSSENWELVQTIEKLKQKTFF
jgi:hypothetical protein